MSKVPRFNNKEIQEIINRDDLNNNEKAILIHRYDYNMCCRETNGYLPKMMSEEEIVKELGKL